MPKAGKFEYPNIGLDTTIKTLRKFHEIIKTDETSREVIAQTLGMSIGGGRFISLILSLDKYGLIKTGGKKIIITNRGKFALYGNNSEIKNAKNEAVSNVELFAKIHNRYGQEANEERIRAFLLQEANIDISKAQKTAKIVNRIYNNVSKYITSAKQSATPTQVELGGKGFGRRENKIQSETETPRSELLQIKYGDFYVEATKEDAKAIMLILAKKLGIDFDEKS